MPSQDDLIEEFAAADPDSWFKPMGDMAKIVFLCNVRRWN
jgi:hypothetical protein